jgi:hypothetical protein
LIIKDTRNHTGFASDAGASVGFRLTNSWGIGAGFNVTTAAQRSADNGNTVHVRFYYDRVMIARETPP